MCIRDRGHGGAGDADKRVHPGAKVAAAETDLDGGAARAVGQPVSYTHLRAHETVLDLVCRLLLEKKKKKQKQYMKKNK